MILCPVAHLARYQSLNPRFAAVVAFLKERRHEGLAEGKHPIDGEDLFIIIEQGTAKDRAVRRFEGHRAYIDIQVNLEGGETMDWTSVLGLTVEDDFKPDGDIRFFASQEVEHTRLRVEPGMAAVFFPEDAHRPSLPYADDQPEPYRKAIFKVRI
ncbi:MAG: hypothetical protein RLZZ127_502 [Planctomycetota bacterium]|jgi:YhcH/YjgK/YiaL family protein